MRIEVGHGLNQEGYTLLAKCIYVYWTIEQSSNRKRNEQSKYNGQKQIDIFRRLQHDNC
jgi:hypothetical protein